MKYILSNAFIFVELVQVNTKQKTEMHLNQIYSLNSNKIKLKYYMEEKKIVRLTFEL